MDASTVRTCLSPVLYRSRHVSQEESHRLFSFSSFRPCNVESLMSVPHFRAKHLLLTHLLHRGIQLISIIHRFSPKLDYTRISDMENILCNIYLILSEVLYDWFRVRNTPIEELALPTQCIASARDFCHADIELIKILMLIMLDFSNVSLHRCGLLICFKGNISFWLTHLKQYLRVHNLL